MAVPANPKIYHIVHVDRLPSIIKDGYLWSDAEARARAIGGTAIGMGEVKQSRLTRRLSSYPDLYVGECVPFYFCPRSVMLYVIHAGNHPALSYRGGQEPIIHLEADLRRIATLADRHKRRWAFTSANAASSYFDDFNDLSQLSELDWDAIQANQWSGDRRHPKQAEFLVEESFPWHMVSRIGVNSARIRAQVLNMLQATIHRPAVEIRSDWYY